MQRKKKKTSHRNYLRGVTHSQETSYPISIFSAMRTYTHTYVHEPKQTKIKA